MRNEGQNRMYFLSNNLTRLTHYKYEDLHDKVRYLQLSFLKLDGLVHFM